ncbi:hypothetical protein BGZ83_002166 [Gryganskiella cystojenkinii]|nr:hypothetical protein BGZ83_002166 [Gryganskiella cystojenkinii]
MGKLGALNHVSLSSSDFDQSKKFYRFLLVDLLQYKQFHEIADWIMWVGANGSAICISPGNKTPHHKFNPGLHHLAFNAETKEQVDEFYKKIVDFQAKSGNEKSVILDKPAEHSEYGAGYYSVYFTDPDGIKLEIASTPEYQ